jgi:hypothetical protein
LLWLAPAADALINASQPVPSSAVDVTAQGVVWSDESGVFRLVSPDGRASLLDGGGGPNLLSVGVPDRLTGSGNWVAALADGGRSGVEVVAGHLPDGLHALAGGPPVGPGGCRDWAAAPAPVEDLGDQIAFAVNGNELSLAGTPVCRHATPAAPRPLFARSLPGGTWHVLRWLPNTGTPRLVAAGPWLAIGTAAANGSTSVDVINARTGRLRNHVSLPGTYETLALDESGLLVAAVLPDPPAPLPPPGSTPVVRTGPAAAGPTSEFRMYWVAPGSRRLRPLPVAVGSMPDPVWSLSDGRLAYVMTNDDATSANPNGTTTLAVTDLRRHTTRRVSGFGDERDLLAFDLGGSRLAWVQTESTLLPTSMWSCTTGPFATGPRTLHVLDLRTSATFIPPPPVPVLPAATISCPEANEQ